MILLKKFLVTYWNNNPLQCILILAFLVRLLAVFLAKGYMMHDDHFLTIEPSSSWAAGSNFNDWLPGINNTREHPEPISFFYLGFLFVIFKLLHLLGIDHPDMQMVFIRFIHACFSLLIVYYGYKITRKLSDERNAKLVGLLLAFIAVLPNFSVRNLAEIVCIPPLMFGFWILVKNSKIKSLSAGQVDQKSKVVDVHQPTGKAGNLELKFVLLAGFVMGLAVGLRYQTVLIVAGVGIWMLLQKQIRNAILFGVVSFTAFFITQIDDVLLWGGEPFQHLMGYFGYNTEHASQYPGSPIAYLSFIGLFILPPISLFLLTGFFFRWKKLWLITLPVSMFLIFHILYPNRQERFILPALPFFVIVGVIGWNEFAGRSKFWLKNVSLKNWCWRIFWTLNTIAMLALCFTYGKKARVEAMLYLYNQHDCRNFLKEASASGGASMPPQFYSGNWTHYSYIEDENDVDAILGAQQNFETQYKDRLVKHPVPNYFLFYDDTRLEERVARAKKYFPSLEYQTTIEPGWFDKLLHTLNDKNSLEKIHIYRTP